MRSPIRVLMAGPGREVRGGVSAVVNVWYALGLDRQIELFYLPSMEDGSSIRKLLVFAKACLRFGGLMRHADILHVHLSPRASFARKAFFVERAHRMGKRIIIHQHGGNFRDFYYRESSPKKQAYIRRIFSLADRVIVLSGEWRDFFADGICDPAKLLVIPNGIIPPKAAKSDYHDHQVLYLGQLTRMKGIYDLLEAIPLIVREIPDAVFHLCGDGDIDACRLRAKELGIDAQVRFPGWIGAGERERLFSSCSTFVLPSYIEGMPMSLLEAMGHGLACVTTPVGGIPRLVTDRESGLFAAAGDHRQLADRLIALLSDETARRRIGTNAAAAVRKHFNAEDSMRQLLALYRGLCGENGV